MQVIFLQDVKNVGRKGQLKNVPDGYARNFLLAKKLAAIATPSEIARLKREGEQKQMQLTLEKQDLQKLAQALEGKQLVIKARAKDGKLFGSITPKDIAQEARKAFLLEIPEKAIPQTHIKELGQHKLKLTFEFGIVAQLTLVVDQA